MLWVEVGVGILFAYLYWHYGISPAMALVATYCCLFIALMIIDLEYGIIPNRLVYPGIAAGLLISIWLPPSEVIYYDGKVPALLDSLPDAGIVQSAVGGSFGLISFLLILLISRGGMGWGDVKMAALIGIATGYLAFVALLIAVVLGGLAATVMVLYKVKNRKEAIPFAPYLSTGAVATLIAGSFILDWYNYILF